MLPSRFEYAAPHSLDEALDLLHQRGDEAKLLAGGQSLIPLMKLRFASPGLLVDLNGIPGLSFIEETEEYLRIGALTRHADIESSSLIRSRYPVLADAAPMISDPIVRNRGTVAGSLAHADPAGDWGSVMLATNAEVVVRNKEGARHLPVSELLVDTFTTTLEPTEIITEVRVPKANGRSGGSYLKLERRVGDFATVAVAVQVSLDNGNVESAGIGLTAVGSKNLAASRAIDALTGHEASETTFEEAARLAAEECSPISDVRGSADYKRAVVNAFVKRGLTRAVELARAS